MNIISQNVQVIFAVGPTIHDMAAQTTTASSHSEARRGIMIHLRASLWEEGGHGCKLPVSPAVGKREKLNSSKNITWFHWPADQPLWSLHHFNLFWMLIVESRGFMMAAHPWYPIILNSRQTVLPELDYSDVNSIQQSLCWQYNVMLSSHNAFECTSISVGKFESPARITPDAWGLSVLLEW